MVKRLGWSQTIRAHLTLGFGLILLLNCISTAIGYGSLQRLRTVSQTNLDSASQVREVSLELNTHFLLARQASENYLETWQVTSMTSQGKKFIALNQTHLAQARKNLQELHTLQVHIPQLTNHLLLLESLFDNYESAFAATTERIDQKGSRYQIHQRLQQELNALTAEQALQGNETIPQLLWELVVREQAYFTTGDYQYISDVRASLDQLDQVLTRLDSDPSIEPLNTLLQNYIANLNALLLLDQQVRVNRIITENIHQEIDQIIEDIGAASAAKATQARLELSRTAYQSSAALLATAISALILTIWASIWLSRRIMIPLGELSEAAELIAAGNLSQALCLPGNDEFSKVAKAFNKMVYQLRQTLATLEQRVAERTQALATTNQTLQAQTQVLESALQKLHHSEANYRLLIDHLQAGVVVHAPDTAIIMGNQTAVELLNIPPDEMVGLTAHQPNWPLVDEFGTALPLDQYPVHRVLNSRKPLQNQVVGIKRIAPDDCVWVLVNAFPTFDAQQRLTQVVVTFTDITDRIQAEAALRHRALHDALTGLPNRTLLIERLNHAIQQIRRYPAQKFAVLFIDLDRFKVINDSLGHMTGDQLLIQVAQTLVGYVRDSDTVARLGGDEFVILLEQITSLQEAIHVVERIQADLKSPLTLAGQTLFTSASIGVAFSDGAYSSGEEILRDADNAMYCAKAKGHAGYAVFNPDMHQSAIQLFKLETDLRQAIERQDFILHFQPIVEVTGQELLGFEALVRWLHPQRGTIPPSQFIPLAEETGLILPLSQWILNQACRQMAIWCHQFPAAANVKMSVNLAARQFQTPNFCSQLDQVLAETCLPAHNLKLEVTESLLLAHVDIVLATLSNLKQRGIEISIDDFGTGYSSLSYLKRFPIHTLKIDKSFVDTLGQGEDDGSIVEAIIQISHSLGMTVVAEGVETVAQKQRLKQLGCGAIQGYLIAPPLTSEAATTFIKEYLQGISTGAKLPV